jgi:predicted ribosome quality control (RQC) complex YloA/Tae2 family protein
MAMSSGYSLMPTILRKALFLCVCLIFLIQLKRVVASQKHDYLTEEEIEQLREAQEPPLRMNVLTGILNKRFEKVRSATPSKTSAKEEEKEEGSNSRGASQKLAESKASPSNPKEGSRKAPPETLEKFLNDYLNCVDEMSTNVENSRSLPLDPKEYLKSLNKLDGFLQKQNQWFKVMEIKSLSKAERETTDEILQAQHELAEDLEKAMDQLMEEIKRIKDAKKEKEKEN